MIEPGVKDLLDKARQSISAAELLFREGYVRPPFVPPYPVRGKRAKRWSAALHAVEGRGQFFQPGNPAMEVRQILPQAGLAAHVTPFSPFSSQIVLPASPG